MSGKTVYAIVSVVWLSTFMFIACSNAPSQIDKEKGISLNWKLAKNDSLTYETVMTEIGESTFEMDLGGIFNKFTDSTKNNSHQLAKDFFNKFKDKYNNTSLLTILTNSIDFENVINIEMITKDTGKKNEEGKNEDNKMNKMMNSMMKGTMLRGSVYSNGSLHSFWMKSNQKNLLSLFFELPNKPLNIGDTWTLENVNLIGNDQNFICKEAQKKNIITLVDVIEKDGVRIAIIDYDILEYVSGDFNSPAFFGNSSASKKTTMEFIYKAQAEFAIDKGKWVSYNGIMSINASGVMNSVQKKKFALIEK